MSRTAVAVAVAGPSPFCRKRNFIYRDGRDAPTSLARRNRARIVRTRLRAVATTTLPRGSASRATNRPLYRLALLSREGYIVFPVQRQADRIGFTPAVNRARTRVPWKPRPSPYGGGEEKRGIPRTPWKLHFGVNFGFGPFFFFLSSE